MLHRREFLRATSVAASSLTLAGFANSATAIEPISRNGRPKFKFSLAAY